MTDTAPTLLEQLQPITEQLAAATTAADVYQVVLEPALRALGAVSGLIMLLDKAADDSPCLRTVAQHGHVAGVPSVWQPTPLTDTAPTTDALRRRTPLYFSHSGDLKAAYPELEAQTGAISPVASAVLPMILDGEPLGILLLDFKEPHEFTPEERRFLGTLAAQCAVALGRAHSTATLESQVTRRTRDLEEQRAALDAFVRFSEAVGTQTDVLELAGQALGLLQGRFAGSSGMYYQPRRDQAARERASEAPHSSPAAHWQAGRWTPELTSAEVQRGETELETWLSAQAQPPHEVIFLAQPPPAHAICPLWVDGHLVGLLALTLPADSVWTDAERLILHSVRRSLNLALERASLAERLKRQNSELETRTALLESFAVLARDFAFETDPYVLVQKAQGLVLPLLPLGAVAYYELENETWRVRVQGGQRNSEALWQTLSAGLPLATTPILTRPWQTGEALYQDVYDPAADQLSEVAGHVGACASLPVLVGGQPHGVFVVGLYGAHTWTRLERAVLETVTSSLSLVLERAQSAAVLAQRTLALEAANEELEGFTYSVSHDLRTPVRHVAGFATLARRALDSTPNPRAERFLDIVAQAAERMNALVDAILELSRTSRAALKPEIIDLNTVLEQVHTELLRELAMPSPDSSPPREVAWTLGRLPTVVGDRRALTRVFTQLLSNALKFSRPQQVARIEVWAETRPGEWAISVRDNGVGFSSPYQHKLFGMFQRLHRQDEFEGAGVGLATVRRIVARHGGQVFAQSEVNQGATFGFTLPRREENAALPQDI